MIEAIELGTVRLSRKPDMVRIQEVFEPSIMGRVFGAMGALAFSGAALFFWQMPVENADDTTFIVRIILCGGMLAIGIAVGRSALIPRNYVTRLEFDRVKRIMFVVEVKDDGACDEKHAVPFAAIKRFYAGSQGHYDPSGGGSTILYMEGEGGPRNGCLIVGSVRELEGFAKEANGLLEGGAVATNNQARGFQTESGFGRKGMQPAR